MTKLPFLPVAAPIVGEREIAYVTDAVKSGWVSSIGPYIDRFEEAFARFVGARHGIALANGTVALHLALHALGAGPGDEVIIPDLTFAATAHTVLQTGATPVLADVDPETWCLDPRAVIRALSPRTRAIVPVHLYGHPADMPALSAIAKDRGLVILEDAAEAHGASIAINGAPARVGSIGDLAAFSFYGNKIITTGEGGMLTTNDAALARRCRFLKDHGMSPERRYFHTELAFNYRMTNLAAALGLAQVEQAEALVDKKRLVFAWYREELGDLSSVTLNPERPGCTSVFWMSSVVLGDDVARDREDVRARMREAGVDTRPFFVPMSELPHLAHLRRVGASSDACPVSARLARRGINVPSGNSLERGDVARAAAALREAIRT